MNQTRRMHFGEQHAFVQLKILLWLFLTVSTFAFSEEMVSQSERNKSAGAAMNPITTYEEITSKGERGTLMLLKHDPRKWEYFIGGVSSGQQSWLDIAVLLVPHARGLQAYDIKIALEEALVAEPLSVLKTVSANPRMLAIVCGPSAQSTYELSLNSINERWSSVESTHLGKLPKADLVLSKEVDQCIRMLELAESNLKKKYRIEQNIQ